MATKETVPGLLSKVAKFVRNPTKDWSDLDHLDSTPESGYDKHALKEMIERKRQNDFVRRREFDQLRKLRSKEGPGVGSMARTSTFQSSLTTDQDGRAVTLKKIDEIEAQMSKQWWKGKQDPSDAPAPSAPGGAAPAPDRLASMMEGASTLPTSDNSVRRFNSTKSDVSGFAHSDQADTAVGFGMPRAPVPRGGDRRSAQRSAEPNQFASRHPASTVAFSTSELFAIEVDEMATDPELEEAAIRFANGDDAGAESSLLQALRGGGGAAPEASLSWAAALLDLYRVTSQRDKFDQALVEFAQRFGSTMPSWARASNAPDAQDSQAARQLADTWPRGMHAGATSAAIWDCPAELTVAAMEQLREAMGTHPLPWHLGWSHLQRIAPQAMPLMGELFASLCDEPVDLCFSGADTLVQVLRKMMPSGQRDIAINWWTVRLNALRTMQLHDEFELAALDYCVTYEVSPPAWTPARCHCVSVSAPVPVFANTVPAGMQHAGGPSGAAPLGADGIPGNTLELSGDVLGDASQVLAAVGGPFGSGDRVIVSCVQLVRIDFSAAGSILNWVAVRQSEGCQVQFRDVHRLVAAFFNVIGISEHARVIPKPI